MSDPRHTFGIVGPLDYLELATTFRAVRLALPIAIAALWFFDRSDLLAVWQWIVDVEAAQVSDAFKSAISSGLARS